MKSLRGQLLGWLSALVALVGTLAAGVSFQLTLREANTFLDHQLVQIARSVDEGSQLPAMRRKFVNESPDEQNSDFVIQVWVGGQPGASSRPGFDLPAAPRSGFSYLTTHGTQWRAYTVIYPDRTVQISQAASVRWAIATQSAWRVLLPLGALAPLSLLLVNIVVARVLKPLAHVTEAASHLSASNLAALPTRRVPKEIVPLVETMNDLVVRLGRAIELQRRFLSDAAHELRTPLTALQLQIENLARKRPVDDLDERVEEMLRGSRRASHLVGQLLKVSRYEGQADQATPHVELELNAVVNDCIADLIPLASERGIDLGKAGDEPATVRADAEELQILINNLIDNAIRYTPRGGTVDVSVAVRGAEAVLLIVDTGAGIEPALLPRVFDRFFRAAGQDTEGSGIGLSIVQAIAARHAARVTLKNRPDRSGLEATVVMPLA